MNSTRGAVKEIASKQLSGLILVQVNGNIFDDCLSLFRMPIANGPAAELFCPYARVDGPALTP